MKKILLYFALKYQGDYKKIIQAIKNKEQVSQKQLENIESEIQCQYLTIIDHNYPDCLKHIATPPIVLFYYGDINLLNYASKIAIIGKRENSIYGKNMCIELIDGLSSQEHVIVSGLAKGIDSIAHQAALKKNLKTIAILGSGIDYCYPKMNFNLYEEIKKSGLVISEYPNSLAPQPQNFLIRNRLIAAISSKIVIIEANYKSGTMNTVSFALEYGKEICCVPNLANKKSGCNYLIKQGAKLVETAQDILE